MKGQALARSSVERGHRIDSWRIVASMISQRPKADPETCLVPPSTSIGGGSPAIIDYYRVFRLETSGAATWQGRACKCDDRELLAQAAD